MDIVVLQEITDWNYPNHVYHVIQKQSKLLGYVPAGSDEFVQFEVPLSFSRSRRKFKQLHKYTYDYSREQLELIAQRRKERLNAKL